MNALSRLLAMLRPQNQQVDRSAAQAEPSSRPLAAELWAVEQALATELGPDTQIRTVANRSELQLEQGVRPKYQLDFVPNVGTTVTRSPEGHEGWNNDFASLWLQRLELVATLIEEGWPPEFAAVRADIAIVDEFSPGGGRALT